MRTKERQQILEAIRLIHSDGDYNAGMEILTGQRCYGIFI